MKSIAVILIALSLVHRNADATVKVLHKSLVIPNQNSTFVFESYNNEHLTYALCDNQHLEDEKLNCTVIREKTPYGDDSYSCDVTLKRPNGPHDRWNEPHVSVYPFGQKHVALTLWRTGTRFLNYTVIEMDSCKVNEAAIFTGTTLVPILVKVLGHNDSFDVFFESSRASPPCSEKMCRATIGTDGRLINKPKPLIQRWARFGFIPTPIVAFDDGSSGRGYFYFTIDVRDYIQLLIKPNGTEITLAKHEQPSGFVAISTEHNLLTVCHTLDKKFECSQYDFDGNLKFNTTIPSDDADCDAIHNIPNGGFYVVSSKCKKGPYNYCTEKPQYFIERVGANGTITGSIVFQGLDDSFSYKSPLFYENDAKEVCLSVAATTLVRGPEYGIWRTELIANCFTDAEFSE